LQVRRGSPIRVAESLGPPKSAIPSLIGLPERAATLEIRRLGFTLGTVAHMPDAASPPGTVIAQTPLPNATGFAQPEVALLLADAAPVAASASVMPDLTSLTYGAAQALLARGKFKLAPPVYQDSAANPLTGSRNSGAGPNPPGTIVAQSPAPGERIQPDTPIVLTVAR
jgi:beta-lactam-binding protein with PASTA domain